MKAEILNQLTGEDIHEIMEEYRNYEREHMYANGPVVLIDHKEMAKEVLNHLKNRETKNK